MPNKTAWYMHMYDDGFVQADIPISTRFGSENAVKTAYFRSTQEAVHEAIAYFSERDLDFALHDNNVPLFFDWLYSQTEFSREWYLGLMYLEIARLREEITDLFGGAGPASLQRHDGIFWQLASLGALCREYELSREHKDAVLVRRQQMRGFRSGHADRARECGTWACRGGVANDRARSRGAVPAAWRSAAGGRRAFQDFTCEHCA
jgi:hypothetical protein